MTTLLHMFRVTLLGSRNSGSAATESSYDDILLATRCVLITGAAGDLGRQTALELARNRHAARIYIADLPRSQDAVDTLLQSLTDEARRSATKSELPATEFKYLPLDLASFDHIRQCAASLVAQETRLDLVVLNAGVMRVATGKTLDGYEMHFGVNYLGHALLAQLLMPLMLQSAAIHGQDPGPRLIMVSSEGYVMAPQGGILFDQLKTECKDLSYTQRYGQSKLALILLASRLAREYPQIKTAAIHPGRILTGLATSLSKESLLVRLTRPIAPLVCVSIAEGVKNHLWAANSPELISGGYYEPVGVRKENGMTNDDLLSDSLWQWTQKQLEVVPSHGL